MSGEGDGQEFLDGEGLENGWESQGGIDHTSPRGGKVMMVRVKKRNVWQVAYRFEGDTSSCSYRFSSLDVHVIDQRFNEYSPSRASHLRELNVCKLTSPYMTKNVAPVLQRQIVQCHRKNRISRDRSPHQQRM